MERKILKVAKLFVRGCQCESKQEQKVEHNVNVKLFKEHPEHLVNRREWREASQ